MKKERIYTLLGTLSQNAFSKLQSAGYRFVEQLKVESWKRENKKRASRVDSLSLNSASTYSPTRGQYHRR